MLARQSQRCTRDCPCVLAVTFLEEAQRLLSRFVSVYLDYITRGGAGVGLAGCCEPTCPVRLFYYTHHLERQGGIQCATKATSHLQGRAECRDQIGNSAVARLSSQEAPCAATCHPCLPLILQVASKARIKGLVRTHPKVNRWSG